MSYLIFSKDQEPNRKEDSDWSVEVLVQYIRGSHKISAMANYNFRLRKWIAAEDSEDYSVIREDLRWMYVPDLFQKPLLTDKNG